jgi:hypothetical protein
MTPANIEQFSALLPGNLRASFPGKHWLIRSLSSNNKVVMLVIADQGGGQFSEISVQAFGKTCQCIERALTSFSGRKA